MIPFIANPTELVGAMPLHLACARPLCRLKAPLGLLLLRKRELALAGRTGPSHRQQRKTERSDGERPVVHIAIVCGSWQGASGWRTLFLFCLIFPCSAVLFSLPTDCKRRPLLPLHLSGRARQELRQMGELSHQRGGGQTPEADRA